VSKTPHDAHAVALPWTLEPVISRRLSRRLIPFVLGVAGLATLETGCGFESQISVQFRKGSPAKVSEALRTEHTNHGIRGTVVRDGQVAAIDCSGTIIYDIKEATGSTVLAQRYLIHLRTRPLRKGTRFELNCENRLIVEIPRNASSVEAEATSTSGQRLALPVQFPVASVPLAFRRRLRPEPRTQFALVGWPRRLGHGDYGLEMTFSLPRAHTIREKVLLTASISCSGTHYLQPILPPVASMKQVPAFTIQPSANTIRISVPRIAGAIGTQTEAKRTLSCAHA
jgi:hypothetical protein